MKISIECDSDPQREPPEPPPPYRDGARINEFAGPKCSFYSWSCPCQSNNELHEQTAYVNEVEAEAALIVHLAEAHGEQS